ncbi:hypothetical protein SMD44_08665 [Streptomyces alboflavus]|uniref:Uncharacterized protein n=1 Tax=Streptomyces alboflavus TaxID=67267 RepID=A0A1Z1WRX3_9ACTN|nr:hypothetical protein SMD44_08665 [Streptomyces alboflavus]
MPAMPAARAPRRATEARTRVTGRRATRAPNRPAEPSLGVRRRDREGQNIARPVTASSAGIRVRLARSITRTDTAMAGPSTRNCPKEATPSVAKAATIVRAAEVIAVPTRPVASAAASRRCCPGRARSCSRKRNSRNKK